MSTYYQDANTTILHGDCIETMRGMPENSVDSIVTDPPYGLGFMGKKWDSLPPGEEWAQECLRVLKPGGHLIAFGGSRTWHRLAVAIEDAGFEIRDGVLWLYGSGFPKSHDMGKAITATETLGSSSRRANRMAMTGDDSRSSSFGSGAQTATTTATAVAPPVANLTPNGEKWSGWGTALKPAYEPAVMARKPFTGTVARNVLEHGTGAINIDACRIAGEGALVRPAVQRDDNAVFGKGLGAGVQSEPSGRWPANVILDEHTAELLDQQSGDRPGRKTPRGGGSGGFWGGSSGIPVGREYSDTGGASRFFYCAKAGKSERPVVDGVAHATVKPLKLMRYLVRMVTPPNGVVLDPFAGSGTTIEAATLEGFNSIGIERETDYLPLIQHRINRANGVTP